MLSSLSALSLALAAPQSAPLDCAPVEGWDAQLADDDAQYLVIGEMHGTVETPAVFADLVCLTGQIEPVVVALEQPVSSQKDIERFLASDGGQRAIETFEQSTIWTNAFKDGRSSEAMFDMFERLRQYSQAGIVTAVMAFQVTGPEYSSPLAYEQGLASKIIEAAGSSRALVYVGNVHALRQEVHYRGGYMPMAGHLPRSKTATFDTIGNGGTTWACTAPNVCGETSLGSNRAPQDRHVVLADDTETARYSGVIYLGTTTTPSPPRIARQETP